MIADKKRTGNKIYSNKTNNKRNNGSNSTRLDSCGVIAFVKCTLKLRSNAFSKHRNIHSHALASMSKFSRFYEISGNKMIDNQTMQMRNGWVWFFGCSSKSIWINCNVTTIFEISIFKFNIARAEAVNYAKLLQTEWVHGYPWDL